MPNFNRTGKCGLGYSVTGVSLGFGVWNLELSVSDERLVDDFGNRRPCPWARRAALGFMDSTRAETATRLRRGACAGACSPLQFFQVRRCDDTICFRPKLCARWLG